MPGHEWRVACIGAGYFSRFHYDAWARMDGAQPVASVDQDRTRAASTGLAAYTDVADMLAREVPDIVDIITPPTTHADLVAQAIDYGAKAIICQKPFCETFDQAKAVATQAEQAGVPLIIHENFRFQPWYRVIHTHMQAGDIGDVLQLTFRLRPGDGQGPKAYLDRQPYFQDMPRFLVHETAVHWIDTFRFLLGAPTRVFADLRRLNPAIAGEDSGYLLFAYENGVRAMFDGNRLLDHAAENTRCTMGEALVEGTTGTLSLGGDGSVGLRRFGETAAREILAASEHKGFGGDCVYHLQAHVIRALNGKGEFENTARDYLDVIATENAIYRSADEGRWVDL